MHKPHVVGEKLGNFLVARSVEIGEIQSTLVEVTHLPTGAQILQIANEDEENLFALSFSTRPSSSNGVAHILEHTVLCGSEKFPVRDPFFSMTRRSLNTFMNAMTGDDFTCYPASSQVEQDFYNLLEVYLDAVFHPKLAPLSFLQEGFRLESTCPTDPHAPLCFKGIVYNEMKGALATGEARLSEAVMHALFPQSTYGVNSGGDPKEIPSLTYEGLLSFYRTYYHPSRCLFYFYGNLPLEKHLLFLEREALAGVTPLPPLPPLPRQPRFSHPVEKVLSYPLSPDEKELERKTWVGLSWLTCSILEQEELLALSVLEIVLMGTDAAPLKQPLLASRLCHQVDVEVDSEKNEVPFSLICKGCPSDSGAALAALVRTTLEKLAREGLPPELVDGALHQLELARMEITGGSSPYGLHLFFRSGLLKQQGGNPEDGLRIHTLFARLRERLENPRYLPDLLKKWFLDNPHAVQVVLRPDPTLLAEEKREEEQKLSQIAASLSPEQRRAIQKEAEQLAALQEHPPEEGADTLPKVTLKDVAPQGKEFPLISLKEKAYDLFYHPCFTNDLIYVDWVMDLPAYSEEELPYLRLFSLLAPQLGCGGRNYQQQLSTLLAHTGGVDLALDLNVQSDDITKMKPSLSLRGKALARKAEKLFPLLWEMNQGFDVTDRPRLEELLKQHLHGLEQSIERSPLRYATNLAGRGLSEASTLLYHWYGLGYVQKLRTIVAAFERDPSSLIDRLEEIQRRTLGHRGDLVLCCEEKLYEPLLKSHFYDLPDFPRVTSPWRGGYPLPSSSSQARLIASPVAFTTLLMPSIGYTHPDAAALSVAAEIMDNLVLHKRIREQGGAYGTGAVHSTLSHQFYFYAYRDPHLSSSLGAFQEAIETLVKGKFSYEDIEEAQLSLFQDLDAPVVPGARAGVAYERLREGRTPPLRQRFRESLRHLSKKAIQEAVKAHLLPQQKQAIVVSFGNEALFTKENRLLPSPLPLYKVDYAE